jgi:hypothetical protein
MPDNGRSLSIGPKKSNKLATSIGISILMFMLSIINPLSLLLPGIMVGICCAVVAEQAKIWQKRKELSKLGGDEENSREQNVEVFNLFIERIALFLLPFGTAILSLSSIGIIGIAITSLIAGAMTMVHRNLVAQSTELENEIEERKKVVGQSRSPSEDGPVQNKDLMKAQSVQVVMILGIAILAGMAALFSPELMLSLSVAFSAFAIKKGVDAYNKEKAVKALRDSGIEQQNIENSGPAKQPLITTVIRGCLLLLPPIIGLVSGMSMLLGMLVVFGVTAVSLYMYKKADDNCKKLEKEEHTLRAQNRQAPQQELSENKSNGKTIGLAAVMAGIVTIFLPQLLPVMLAALTGSLTNTFCEYLHYKAKEKEKTNLSEGEDVAIQDGNLKHKHAMYAIVASSAVLLGVLYFSSIFSGLIGVIVSVGMSSFMIAASTYYAGKTKEISSKVEGVEAGMHVTEHGVERNHNFHHSAVPQALHKPDMHHAANIQHIHGTGINFH